MPGEHQAAAEADVEVEDYFPYEGDDSLKSPDSNTFPIHRPPIYRQYTQEDAQSLVGGETISLEDLDGDRKTSDKPHHGLGKVFLFSLPFGGLSGIMAGFKLPALPFGSKEEEIDEDLLHIRHRIDRQLSVSTQDEARHFSTTKGLDNVRMRAMKTTLLENISELVPDFILKNKRSYESVYSELDGPILVMGGYRGSILRETGTGKRAWVPIKAGLHLRHVNLLLGPNREDELRATDYIYPDGVLKNIGPFDICKKFIKKLQNGKTLVKEFGYDWRLSLDITADQLIEQLEALYKKTGKRTIVVAHSMGGLVAHGAMQKRPELFRGLIYAGVPSECLNIIGPLRFGDSIMFSDRILTFETNFMMRSSFAFLPLSGRVFANKDTGEHYDLDFFDPDTWVTFNLNPLVSETRKLQELGETADNPLQPLRSQGSASSLTMSPSSLTNSPISSISSKLKQIPTNLSLKSKPSIVTNTKMTNIHNPGKISAITQQMNEIWSDYKFTISFSKAYEYLADTLKRAKEYVLSLEYDPALAHKYPPLAVVYGDKVPSVRGSYVSSPQDIKDGNYYEFFYGRGDGVVHQRWLMPEDKGFSRHDPELGKGHIVGKFSSDRGHVDLMTDLEVMADALSAILEADKTWRH
ncbi:hypothetical protein PUMCH_003258 [Australozyma saopauloensis]|uniref:AB hydrolase-1 domain-containing protein n=1 Tax=Australozyma saopauloensis TaxID=291208 RepID=A0AAX4HC09_9ASCO|nr:hypothetical protein PUMCH_003258 [[Candida] saopauloensis]